ncbi:radical SAM family heme chaperone HemW [Cochlodiniinecator piscidefendens]|uniref:radical SAM family heme chaperone HemW n=1 Tax=Cochlodiniinecator piscidefendens TaxID=2715756 RepID=UPI00140B19AD|nr:radical SAM family heme chaperone HemW [Cochlodiniinecator piscidefendens]
MLLQNSWLVVLTEDWQNGGFGLYVHWPFCQSKCPYCDFNSHVAAEVDESRWVRAYLSEIERYGKQTQGRTLDSIFFGGGTPSLMAPETVDAILTKARETWNISNNIEISLEANPTSIEAGRFKGYRDAGVNRVSMGAQALNDADLKRLGRLHTAKEATQAFDIAKKNFDRVSFDLIYARQHQTADDWRKELSTALDLALDHLSLYQLTIEAGTAFGDRYDHGKLAGLPPDDTAADMYDITQEICEAAGLPAYEISNHARPGAESRHNLIYWQYGDYVGVGPGAHGRITVNGTKQATETYLMPNKWLTEVEENQTGESLRNFVPMVDQATEYLMMGLRLSSGINLDRYEKLNGAPIPSLKLTQMCDDGFLIRQGQNLLPTQSGRVLLNAVLRELLV